jgi:hypothetical protein
MNIQSSRHLVVLLAVICTTTGCSLTRYENLKVGALARVAFPFIHAGGTHITRVGIADHMSCTALQWHHGEAEAVVRADKPLYIIQGVEGVYSGGCKIAYSFVPQEGARYVSEFLSQRERCELRLWRLLPDGSRVAEASLRRMDKPFCLNI